MKIFFEDEARFGMSTTIYKVWSKRGQKPVVKIQRGREYLNEFCAICPYTGEVEALSSPYANTEVMNIFLRQLSERHKGYEVAIFMDNVGYHKSKGLKVPENIHMKYLPTYSPQLNPVELLWEYMRMQWTGNRYYENLDKLEDVIAKGFNELFEKPNIVKSLSNFHWIKNVEVLF